jgi:hypothetical protein
MKAFLRTVNLYLIILNAIKTKNSLKLQKLITDENIKTY